MIERLYASSSELNAAGQTWNLLHLARLLKDPGGFCVGGNSRRQWEEDHG